MVSCGQETIQYNACDENNWSDKVGTILASHVFGFSGSIHTAHTAIVIVSSPIARMSCRTLLNEFDC